MTLYDKLKDKETLNNYKYKAIKGRVIEALKETELVFALSLFDATYLYDIYFSGSFDLNKVLNLFNE